MIELIKNWIERAGFEGDSLIAISTASAIIIVLFIAWLSNLITKKIILKVMSILVRQSQTKWDDILLEHKVFNRLSLLVPGLVIYLFAPVFYTVESLIQTVCMSYLIIVAVLAFNSFLNAVDDIYRSYEISKQRPIKGYIQVVQIVLYVMAGIFVIATLMGKSPWYFLSGLGALTAVLMLVFKDSILGLVASIQLTSNDMVRIGDWIEMPKYGADGDIIDISLNTIKVQNWDKTITTIPSYSLMSDSFKNWRGMSESGGRRIKRAVNIDMNSVKFCDNEMLNRFEKFQLLKEYIKQKREEIALYNKEHNIYSSTLVNGRNLTNLGTFRAYLVAYLRNHPKVHQDMTFLIRHLPPDQNGLRIQIYVFSNDQEWARYEAIQADIFDHILAVIPEFGLRVFQNPTGYDFRAVAESKRQS